MESSHDTILCWARGRALRCWEGSCRLGWRFCVRIQGAIAVASGPHRCNHRPTGNQSFRVIFFVYFGLSWLAPIFSSISQSSAALDATTYLWCPCPPQTMESRDDGGEHCHSFLLPRDRKQWPPRPANLRLMVSCSTHVSHAIILLSSTAESVRPTNMSASCVCGQFTLSS